MWLLGLESSVLAESEDLSVPLSMLCHWADLHQLIFDYFRYIAMCSLFNLLMVSEVALSDGKMFHVRSRTSQ